MKQIFGLILIAILFINCSSIKREKKSNFNPGIYTSNISGNQINFLKDSTYVLTLPKGGLMNMQAGFDILSFGKWKLDKNLIILNSSEKITNYLQLEVVELSTKSKDSIYIDIENKYTGLFNFEDSFIPYYKYSVDFEGSMVNPGDLFTNKICLPKNGGIIKRLRLVIYPNLQIYPQQVTSNTLYTKNYKVENLENNTFKIKINDFDLRNFSYIKYNGDLIKIDNKDTLIWNNEKFIRLKQ